MRRTRQLLLGWWLAAVLGQASGCAALHDYMGGGSFDAPNPAGQATLQSTSKAQLSSTNMPTQTMGAQAIAAQAVTDPSGQVPPATTGRSYRSPFRRDTVAPPPPVPTSTSTATSTPPVTPPPSDVDDAPFRPARMPE